MDIYKQKEKLEELNMSRAYGYMFLKKAFYVEPTKEYIETLSKGEYLEEFPFSSENNLIKKGVQEIELYLLQEDITGDEKYNKLHWDYTKMFIGPRELPAPPWESSHMNRDKLLFQEETLQVRMSYLKYNFIPANYPHEADDHIALELDFMYRLCMKLNESIGKGEKGGFYEILLDQKHFLEHHLVKWIPTFTERIAESAETDYYQGIAKVLDGFIQLDYQIVTELLNALS